MAIGALVQAGTSAMTSVMNMAHQSNINNQNLAFQKDVNDRMEHMSRNANAIAVADRLNAGLSPLDATPAETPSLGTTPANAAKLDTPNVGSLVESALDRSEVSRVNDSVIAANNSRAVNEQEEAVSKSLANLSTASTLEEQIAANRAAYNNIKDKGSEEARQLKKRTEELEAAIKNIVKDTALKQSQMDLNSSNVSLNSSQTSLNSALKTESEERANKVRQEVIDLISNARWFDDLGLPHNANVSSNAITTEMYRFSSGMQRLKNDVARAIGTTVEQVSPALDAALDEAFEAAGKAGVKGFEAIKSFVAPFLAEKFGVYLD